MSNPNLGRSAPYIEINLPDGEALDLRFRNDDGSPKDFDGPQKLYATVIGFHNPDAEDLPDLGVVTTNRVVAVFDPGMGDNYLVNLGNDALTAENVVNRLLEGNYTKDPILRPNPKAMQEIYQARNKGPQFHSVIDNEGYVDLITADQDKVVLATKDPSEISDIIFNQSADTLLSGDIGLKTVAVTIDDESWGLLADHLEKQISQSEQHQDPNIPPALGNLPPLFESTPLDLGLLSLADRLNVIDHYRNTNEADLRTAMEIMELIVAERHNRPANKDRITEASWNAPTLEERVANEAPEDLGMEFGQTRLVLERLEQDIDYQVRDNGIAKHEDLMQRDVLRCAIAMHRELGDKFKLAQSSPAPS